jgi:hypothetical protein
LSVGQAYADLVEAGEHLGRVGVDAVGAGAFQFLTAVAARLEADAERTGAPGGEQVPDAGKISRLTAIYDSSLLSYPDYTSLVGLSAQAPL